MSAFVVEDKTINRILSFINRWRDGSWYTERLFTAAELNPDHPDAWERLGQSLLLMNYDAVNARYTEQDVPTVFEFHWTEAETDIQVFKSMQCFLYQCSEGTVPERALYKALDQLKNGLAERIISNLPQYDKAIWG